MPENMKHVLIAEDETKIRESRKDYLEKSGYKVSCLDKGSAVIPFIKSSMPDLILLDIMLPEKDGLDICRELRAFSAMPVIMITARADEIDRLLGLELGADDYICKPFSPREVVARVKAVLRRSSTAAAAKTISAGGITINTDTREAKASGELLKLTPAEFNLLFILISSPGRVFTRSELINAVQGYDYEGYDRTIDTHIKNLRKKLQACMPDNDVICSVYGIGYKLLA
jgi:two-component system response regulator BaeR